ncbi:hypothetical protein [Geomonas sp.]|nr:hypothetical protein [Geomonas sp.]
MIDPIEQLVKPANQLIQMVGLVVNTVTQRVPAAGKGVEPGGGLAQGEG